ncbi:MAG: hypothetical protein KJS68_02745, partial [Alphaproteobacteria bacterium]|nr:hypothetical protein [Alphaproteobacteria bacterium]
AVIAWRSSRAMKGRPVSPSRLWIRPALIAAFMALALATSRLPGLFGLALYSAAAAAGTASGYLLARHQELTLDPDNHKIISKTSPIGVILFVVLFGVRYILRTMASGGEAPDKLAAHSGQIALYTDAGLLFLLALVSAQAWEIWRRTRPLVMERAARMAKPATE